MSLEFTGITQFSGETLSLSHDGHLLAFSTNQAYDPRDTNGVADIYIKDFNTGTIRLASCNSDGSLGNQNSLAPTLTPDGRYLLFWSQASNFAANDTNNTGDLFRKDLLTGELRLVSVNQAGVVGGGPSYQGDISADGNLIVFRSHSFNFSSQPLISEAETTLLVKDMRTGNLTQIWGGSGTHGGYGRPTMSADGTKIAYTYAEIKGSSSARYFFFNEYADGKWQKAQRVNTNSNGNEAFGKLADDGQHVLFSGNRFDKLAGGWTYPGNPLLELHSGILQDSTRNWVSHHPENATWRYFQEFSGAISSDGKIVAFIGPQGYFNTNVGTIDHPEAFIQDTQSGNVINISHAIFGKDPFSTPYTITVSGDGRYVAISGNPAGAQDGNLQIFRYKLPQTINNPLNFGDSKEAPARLAGGVEDNLYQVQNSGTQILEYANGGTDTVFTNLHQYTLPANVEQLTLTGDPADKNQYGYVLNGNALDNYFYTTLTREVTIYGGDGNDVFATAENVASQPYYEKLLVDGGNGTDSYICLRNYDGFSHYMHGGKFWIDDANGLRAELVNVERVHFYDTSLALDVEGTAGQAYRIYQAAFNRKPDPSGLGFWIKQMDKGMSQQQVAKEFIRSAEFLAQYGTNPGNLEAVSKFYTNVLHRPADSGGLQFWTSALDQQRTDLASVLAGFSESAENKAALVGVMSAGMQFTPA